MKKNTFTTLLAVVITAIITGVCLYFDSSDGNGFCLIASWILGCIAGGIVYYREKFENEAEEQLGRFVLIYLIINVITWFVIFYRYNTSFYEKVKRHTVVRKEVLPAGYKVKARFFLICSDTVIETDAGFYYSVNPPQIIYHTSEIR